jgi:hypothetical protein
MSGPTFATMPDGPRPDDALPVAIEVAGNTVHIGWVLTLEDLPDLLDAVADQLREMTAEALARTRGEAT